MPRRRAVDSRVDAIAPFDRLREDFDRSDLVLIHMANAGVVNATGEAAPDAWRRVVAPADPVLVDPHPLPASPEHDALYRAMLRTGPVGIATAPVPDKGT